MLKCTAMKPRNRRIIASFGYCRKKSSMRMLRRSFGRCTSFVGQLAVVAKKCSSLVRNAFAFSICFTHLIISHPLLVCVAGTFRVRIAVLLRLIPLVIAPATTTYQSNDV